ncbi:MAG: hypothetical protein A3E85_02855 [Gammaproteobacteria bacterium RIFCSPHIGHO2_12_FULL_45_12]|nr:MAG: hypothetical protein A3E85_02855 [Gammaproteobacteria bacterium RIFCSPHIGHO2_12_FULL_45_12]
MPTPLKTVRLSLLCCSALYLSLTSPTLFAAENNWTVQVAPYLWAISMNGTVGVGNRRTHVDQSFSKIMQEMSWGGMLWLDANKGKWGAFLNTMYADLKSGAHEGPLSVNATNHFGIFSAGISYLAYQTCLTYSCSSEAVSRLTLEPYAGFRFTLNDTTIKASIPGLTLQNTKNENWTDPIVGARVRYTLTRAWSVLMAGDIGGVNTSSQYSYNVTGLLGYQPQLRWTNTTFYLGYRWLDQHYINGSGSNYFNWNMKLAGPLIGIMITI